MTTKTEPSTVGARPATSAVTTLRSSPARMGSARDSSVRQRDLRPTDARYDAFALLEEERDDDLGPRDIFESEPRDPAFASILEKRISIVLETALRELQIEDKVRKIHIECKTLSCYTYIEVAKSDVSSVYDLLNGVLLGDVQSPGFVADKESDVSKVTLYNAYRAATRDEGYYKQFLEEGMRPGLELAKQRQKEEQHEAPR